MLLIWLKFKRKGRMSISKLDGQLPKDLSTCPSRAFPVKVQCLSAFRIRVLRVVTEA